MKHKTLNLTCGKKIDIYQNIFTESERFSFIDFAMNSFYKMGRKSVETSKFVVESFFSSVFSEEDDINFGLNDHLTIKKILKKYKRQYSWINATQHGSMYHTHVDKCATSSLNERYKTLLYPCNMSWDKECGGETTFCNSYGEKEIAVDFIPGQIVVFDSEIPHRAAFSFGHIEPRIMYTCQYEIIE